MIRIDRLYRRLARAFPYEFRAVCGDGLEQLGADVLPLVWRERGFIGVLRCFADLGFRLPLELAMHEMYERGVMPVQMSYSGRNFDIVTGISAFVVAWLVAQGRGGRLLITIWNLMGLALLAGYAGRIGHAGAPEFMDLPLFCHESTRTAPMRHTATPGHMR